MTNHYEMSGTIERIFEPQTFDSGFAKREFVLTMGDTYPQHVKFACLKEKMELLAGLQPGDGVQVTFSIRGNEFKERFYVDLQVVSITKTDTGTAGEVKSPNEEIAVTNDDDDIPPF